MKSRVIPGLILVALAGSACSSSPDTAGPEASGSSSSVTETQAARTTLTDAKLQPPSQDNKYTQSSVRPKVVFDPCTWIDAADIDAVGFRSESRRRGPDLVAEYTFLTCIFRNADNTLSVNVDSGNISWDENLQKNGAWLQATTVNGRQAGLVRGQPGGEDACQVHLLTKAGVVIVGTLVLSLGKNQNLDPCANIMEIASAVEKSIGKEN
ncbi:DUF3558 domain-containing protein [Nocardia salmonicida]|uniref:DUF3558 domain-containing protein n=1 Tax=Nocardia salmonicida TaxID=53431 RepID=UPI002E289B8E|nr:DUF3558 domain-containing protein [Nocardia salmonicida]